jgi:hypothetical protein
MQVRGDMTGVLKWLKGVRLPKFREEFPATRLRYRTENGGGGGGRA